MSRFSAPSRDWFVNTFGAPTPMRERAWRAIVDGGHVLVVVPTGSGKILAAFLYALDSLLQPSDRPRGTRVAYVPPLKALRMDVECSLHAPLAGIREEAGRQSRRASEITVGVRSGGTPACDRDRIRRRPPDVLITTPESLRLMLASSARESLCDVEAVIIDEIHAVAGSKRSTHLTLSLERPDLLAERDVRRVTLSITMRPVGEVAAFLGGGWDVVVVAPGIGKSWDVRVDTPPLNNPWPHVEKEILDSILRAQSTLMFANSRRAAGELTARLNKLWLDASGGEDLACAHHGLVSKQVRAEIKDALKARQLRAVVTTSSLELDIDTGTIDQVIQISAPLFTSSAPQRSGRAGHQVSVTSQGRLHTLHHEELAATVVTVSDTIAGQIEEPRIPVLVLDVLVQQIIAATTAAEDTGLEIETWLAAVRRPHPHSGLKDDTFDAILWLLLDTYPGANFSGLRTRLEWRGDRLFVLLEAGRLAVASGSTISDRGLYEVFLAGGDGPGRRVGGFDEEIVHGTRMGETFTLGASSWTVVGTARNQMLVVPAPGRLGKLPFWIGEDLSRPAELGHHIGELLYRVAEDPDGLDLPWIDGNARGKLVALIAEQREATGMVPDERTVVMERFHDELGNWRIVVHSPLGRAVLTP